MATASYRVLKALFTSTLDFTPTAADVEQFERDLAVVSPSLMRDALIELSQGRSARPAGAGQWREAIYAIYNRKVAEHAQLFPVFHCFETCLRSRIAVLLEEHYQIRQWWAPLTAAVRGGGGHNAAQRIGIVDPVNVERRRALFLMVRRMEEKSLDTLTFDDGYDLLQNSTLGEIKRLIESHWPLLRSFFIKDDGQPIMPEVVLAKFEKVRLARNSVYHHMPFAGMTDVYLTADELLTCLGFHLPRVHRAIEDANCAPPPYF